METDVSVEFDRWLLNLTSAMFGLTMDELGFTETSNRSVGDSQERVIYRNSVQPKTNFLAGYLNRVIRRYHGQELSANAGSFSAAGAPTRKPYLWDGRYQVVWTGIDEPEDFNAKVQAAATMVQAGIIDAGEARRWLKLPREVLSANPLLAGAQPNHSAQGGTSNGH